MLGLLVPGLRMGGSGSKPPPPPFVPPPPPPPIVVKPLPPEYYVIDEDTERAVLLLWQQDTANLPTVFRQLPQTGRLKSPVSLPLVQPTAQIESVYSKSERGTGYIKDRRKVTITVRGSRADVVKGMAFVLQIFNAALGGPKQFGQWIYPSGARFVRWWPLNDGELREEPTTKDGLDVWSGIVLGEVTSVRTP